MAFLGLDIEVASAVLSAERFGDWYRDPWGWPESSPSFAKNLAPEDLGVTKAGAKYRFSAAPDFHLFDIPKSYLGTRPAVVQDVRTRLAYAAAAFGLAPQLHANLPSWVYGWRARSGEYSFSNGPEWALYKQSQAAIGDAEHAAQTDITSFFASINTGLLLARIVEITGENVSTEILRVVFETHNRLKGRSGIPQRSSASAMLAQVGLQGVDDLIESRLQDRRIDAARRWMDDISFEGPEHECYELLLKLQEHGRQVGLEMNSLKTLLTSGEESAERLRIEAQGLIRLPVTTAIIETDYEDFETTYIDASSLLEAEQQVLANPQRSPRSKVGIVLKSLVKYEQFDRALDWMKAAHYLPHAADKLSRYLAHADSEWLGHLGLAKWFADGQDTSWPHLDWVSAQHALAVSSEDVDERVAAVLESWLREARNIQKVAVAVQRLAVRSPAKYRVVVSDRIDGVHDPLIIRLFALGMHMAGAPVADTRAALQRFPNNQLTLRYLDANDWKLPAVANDFDRAPAGDGDEDESHDF